VDSVEDERHVVMQARGDVRTTDSRELAQSEHDSCRDRRLAVTCSGEENLEHGEDIGFGETLR
jgi:hypothetical protein